MSDRIALTGLRVPGNHGVFAHEKRDGQEFVVDVVLWADLAEAAATDRLEATVDYGAVADLAAEIVGGPACDLIEAVAGRIAERVLELRNVEAVEVTVHKPQAPIQHEFADAAVTVSRTRSN